LFYQELINMPEHDYEILYPLGIEAEGFSDSNGNSVEHIEVRKCKVCGDERSFFFSGGEWKAFGGERPCSGAPRES
jgi:hypothetical protein